MSKEIKLLWLGDSPAVTTGFGRVSQSVLENLYSTGKYKISVIGINHPIGDPHIYEGMFRIYPARAKGDIYGINRVEEVVDKEKPDVIIVNSDLWVVSEFVKAVPESNRIFTYSPVDALPVNPDWIDILVKANTRVGAYTEFAKNGIQDVYNNVNIDVVGHGVDTDEFYPIEDARRFLANVPSEVFLVQNVNRNQPRKRLDLFLKAAQIWLGRKSKSDRENILIYYHGSIKDIGWNLVDLANRWGIDDRFLITDQTNITSARGLPINLLCKIYNVANVHVLTSMGEGFGLSPFESAACGVAQVVPDNSATKELWSGVAQLIKIKEWQVLTGGINTEGGVIDVEHLVEILDDLYQNRDKLKKLGEYAYNHVHQEKFTWSYVAKQFDSIISDMLKDDKYLSKKC